MSHFKMGEKTPSKPQHGCSQRGSQRHDRLGFGNRATRMPSICPQLLVVLIIFVLRSCVHNCWFSVVCPIILALKALCKLQGGPLWCLAESDPVLLLGCTGRAALLISAELQDLWLKSTHTYQKTSAISRVYLTWSRDSWHCGTFKFNWSKSRVNPPCDGINPWMDKTGANIC